MGLDIFVHSIRQVFGNFGAALRISALLYLIQVAAVYFLGAGLLANPQLLQMQAQRGDVPWGGLIVALLVLVVTGLWIAVAWHRYILRVEEPGSVIPAFKGDRMLSYFGYSILIVIILILMSLVLGLVVGLVVAPFLGGSPVIGMIIIGILVYVPLVIVGYRLSVVLPAAALGEELGIGGAWEKTQGAMGTLLLLAIVSLIGAVVIDLPAAYVFTPGSILSIIWSAVTQWIVLMVGISILTTLYGVYVEERKLN